jgi:hypothetical protein
MARVLLSAYACEPGRGSEPGVGWNWATELAELGHHVTVITRADNRTMIESHFLPPNLTFVYFDLPRWVQRWRAGLRAKAAYYVLWQWFAARHIRRLFPSPPFDVVHHITYVSARYPSFMGSLGTYRFGSVRSPVAKRSPVPFVPDSRPSNDSGSGYAMSRIPCCASIRWCAEPSIVPRAFW